jgi:UDP-glucose 4-epimerase
VALNHVLQGGVVRVFGDPLNVRDYIHLEDVCTIATKAAISRRTFDLYNVGTGVGHSVEEVLAIIKDCCGYFPIQVNLLEGKALADWVVLDCSRARAELDWHPQIDLRAGIAEMVAEFRSTLSRSASTT